MTNDFRKYAVKHLGMNGLALDQYAQFTVAIFPLLLWRSAN